MDSKDTDVHPVRWALYALATLLVVVLISAGAWGIKVAISGIKGAGDTERRVNEVDNRIGSQEHFEQLYADIQTYDAQLDTAKANWDAAAHEPSDPGQAVQEADRLRSVYTGIQNLCINARNTYDADARKVSKARFRAADLPDQIDPTVPETDCKENTP